MNCPSKVDLEVPDDWNQSPNALNGDATTRSDLGKPANARLQRDHRLRSLNDSPEIEMVAVDEGGTEEGGEAPSVRQRKVGGGGEGASGVWQESGEEMLEETLGSADNQSHSHQASCDISRAPPPAWLRTLLNLRRILVKYAKFIGPGFLISVAYIDPGNYATDVAAGATYRFRLLFMILLSNLFAIFLQSLCIKLGTVTGLNLAEMCRAHMPRWLNYILYVFAEAAIIATDIAEVIGTAIALNLLSHGKLPLVAGCAISIVDVLFILIFYRPNGSMRMLRGFEIGVMLLVLGVVICFCFQLSLINEPVGQVFKGYLPSSALVEGQGLYQACGILGATVMPHSLYLGSGIIQARLKDFDRQHQQESLQQQGATPNEQQLAATLSRSSDEDEEDSDSVLEKYRPSLMAIKSCMSYSIVELAVSLFTFALFVNSAILIVAGASLYNVDGAKDADLFGIYHLLNHSLAPAAGTIFALALLLSGTSAGIVCTIAGQIVSEGQLRLRIKPWLRRLMTRSISITPSIIIAGALGRDGLSAALNASQVALSVILPFVSAPLLYFTCRNKYMTVATAGRGWQTHRTAAPGSAEGESAGSTESNGGDGSGDAEVVKMRNHWITIVFAVLIWGIIVVMNVALLVLLGLGVG